MTTDITFHYPPELFNLLVDAIPALNKSKKDVVIFFRGAGVAENLLNDLAQRVKADPQSIGKTEIARTVLERLNKRGEASLRERRELLRRVVEFTNFDACWPDDQMKAKGLVASVRDIVNQKDAFTRMNQAREEERQARLAGVEQETRLSLLRTDPLGTDWMANRDPQWRTCRPCDVNCDGGWDQCGNQSRRLAWRVVNE
jgi:restriction system protein